MTGVWQNRLDYAKKMGATGTYTIIPSQSELKTVKEIHALFHRGEGAECVLECTGIESSFRTAIMETPDVGTCCLVGVGKNDQSFPVNNFSMREVDIRGLFRYNCTYPTAIALISSGMLDIKHMATHLFQFDDALKAIDTVGDASTNALKVQIMN